MSRPRAGLKIGTIVLGTLLGFWLIPPVAQKAMRMCTIRPSLVTEAQATAQWTRKYGISCSVCHTVFPRLNYTGEQFMRNGYQMPETQDGDEIGKSQVTPRLVSDQLQNFFGVRLNFTPVEVKTADLTENGAKKTRVNVGRPDWIQLFTAGSIYKNVSIFIETEINTAEQRASNAWFRLGFHNLWGRQGLTNVHVGKGSMMEWHTVAGRLRMIGPGMEVLRSVRSSNNKGEDSVSSAGAVPMVSFYGNRGPLVYNVGVSPGAKESDPNRDKNVFGTLRIERTTGTLEGSALSVWGMRGVDSATTSTAKKRNEFWRVSPAAVLRWQTVDVMAAYLYGRDENWTLAAGGAEKPLVFRGVTAWLSHQPTPTWQAVLGYDYIQSGDDTTLDFNKVTPSIWYLPRENLKIGVVNRLDLQSTDPNHPDKKHEFLVNIRTMF